jgi:4'-phosphopantetheinyl transferase
VSLASEPTVEVNFWTVNLDSPRDGSSLATLSAEEIERSSRFRDAEVRRRFRNSHASLRLILARSLGSEPQEVPLTTDDRGKPFVAGSDFNFSMTRSGSLALVALCADAEVGIDVEEVRPVPEALSIADAYFERREFELLFKAPSSQLDRRFLELWTVKEASVKATGAGLAGGLRSTPPGVEVGPLRVGPRHVAALAVRGARPIISRAPAAEGAVPR